MESGRSAVDYIDKARRLGPLFGVLAQVAALVLLCWVLSHWFWRWAAPAPREIEVRGDNGQWAATIASTHFFGAGSNPAAASNSVPLSNIKPLGVIAQSTGAGYALIRSGDNSTRVYQVGEEVSPGVKLDRVDPQGITLRDRDGVTSVALRQPAPPGSAPAKSSSSSACPLTSAELVRAYLLRGELLDGVAKTPSRWRGFLQPQDGALLVTQDAGPGQLLGLQPYDRLERSNGVQLASVDDLDRAFVQPLQKNQAVRITGVRKGVPTEWLYVNAAVCVAPR